MTPSEEKYDLTFYDEMSARICNNNITERTKYMNNT